MLVKSYYLLFRDGFIVGEGRPIKLRLFLTLLRWHHTIIFLIFIFRSVLNGSIFRVDNKRFWFFLALVIYFLFFLHIWLWRGLLLFRFELIIWYYVIDVWACVQWFLIVDEKRAIFFALLKFYLIYMLALFTNLLNSRPLHRFIQLIRFTSTTCLFNRCRCSSRRFVWYLCWFFIIVLLFNVNTLTNWMLLWNFRFFAEVFFLRRFFSECLWDWPIFYLKRLYLLFAFLLRWPSAANLGFLALLNVASLFFTLKFLFNWYSVWLVKVWMSWQFNWFLYIPFSQLHLSWFLWQNVLLNFSLFDRFYCDDFILWWFFYWFHNLLRFLILSYSLIIVFML